jgi:uncharacterized protein DUF1344
MPPHRRSLVLAIVLVTLPVLGETQAPSRPPLHQAGPTVEGQEVEGTIKRIDADARTITLDNGEEYVIPAAVLADPRVLVEGAVVRLRYAVDGGRNLVTFIQVRL